jgi:1-acylglycerone phosphate reductase
MTQAFLQLLLAAREKSQRATVVLSGSLAGVGATTFSSVYGSSKAAAAMLYDVLRLALVPWGVNVVELKTGAVQSQMTTNMREGGVQKPLLPADSLYYVAKVKVELFMSGKAAKPGVPADEWAQMVVKELEKPTPPNHIWGGMVDAIPVGVDIQGDDRESDGT